jgi:hypothetical protein
MYDTKKISEFRMDHLTFGCENCAKKGVSIVMRVPLYKSSIDGFSMK